MYDARILAVTLCLTILGYSRHSRAQDLRNYEVNTINTNDGLPSDETYNVVQDQDGFIWIASDRGLLKYDGNQVKVFDAAAGIPTSCVYHIFLQPDTSIVAVNPKSEFYKVKNDTVKALIHADSIRKYISVQHYPYSYYKDDQNRHHIGTRRGYFCFDGNSHLVMADTGRGEHFVHVLKQFKPSSTFNYTRAGGEYVLKDKTYHSKIRTDNPDDHRELTILRELNLSESYYGARGDKHTFIPCVDKVIVFPDNGNIKFTKFDQYILNLAYFGEHLYVTTRREGVFCCSVEKGEVIIDYQFLKGYSVSSLYQITNGQVWATTLEDGVKIINSNSPEIIYESSDNMTRFLKNDSLFLVGYENGDVDFSHDQRGRRKTLSIKKVSGFEVDGEDILILQGELTVQPPVGVLKPVQLVADPDHYVNPVSFLKCTDSVAVWTSTDKFGLQDRVNGRTFIHKVDAYNLHCVDLCTYNNHYYSADERGILQINKTDFSQLKHILTEDPFVQFFVHNGELHGLDARGIVYVLKKGNISTYSLFKQEEFIGIPDAIYHGGILHTLTKKGVYSWALPGANEKLKLLHYDQIPGCHQIEYHNDSIYFLSNKKVYKRLAKKAKLSHPIMLVKAIQVNEKKQPEQREYHLEAHQNDIEIELQAVALEDPVFNYRYQLIGHDERYFFSKDGYINYSGLSPGDYELELAVTSNEITYSPPTMIKFTIARPFWQNMWFLVLVTTLIVFGLNRLWTYRIRRVKDKARLEHTISGLRSKALAGQLNPHLIFNVLNSIQGKVSDGEEEDANIYIALFAGYLRNALNHLKVNTISLEEELKMIQLYFNLEKMRFDMDVQLKIRSDIGSQDLPVPPLILQPLIENAVKYSDVTKNNALGEIDIHITETGEEIYITVSDNGSGFDAHYSFGDGLRITEERLKILSKENRVAVVQFKHPTRIQLKIKK